MKVSFIIPIYKVEQYIDQCVESILCQTYSDIEVMLVDDGSPDNCPAKCDEWAKKDSRVKALHKLNGGLSDARNYGLEYATGEYVVFVDGDDFWLGKDNLEHLVAKAKEFPEVDFIGFNCSYYYSDSNTCKPWAKYVDELAKPHSNSETICLLTKTSSIVMSAWTSGAAPSWDASRRGKRGCGDDPALKDGGECLRRDEHIFRHFRRAVRGL